MSTKVQIFNLALGALLLTKQISDITADNSTENRVLKSVWDNAFATSLQDMDLDGASSQKTLELLEEDPDDLWKFAYKYPNNCAFFRRIRSCVLKDTRSTQISKRVGMHNGQRVIFTNEEEAIIEYIPKDLAPEHLSESAALAVAYRLAWLAAPLIAGKGSTSLKKEIDEKYKISKAEAQEQDRLENSNFDDDDVQSEFVEERTS